MTLTAAPERIVLSRVHIKTHWRFFLPSPRLPLNIFPACHLRSLSNLHLNPSVGFRKSTTRRAELCHRCALIKEVLRKRAPLTVKVFFFFLASSPNLHHTSLGGEKPLSKAQSFSVYPQPPGPAPHFCSNPERAETAAYPEPFIMRHNQSRFHSGGMLNSAPPALHT